MAMLAEAKYKQKWAEDPRNLNWSEDKGKYGFKMLSKMGWSEGKGLGANENGTVSHVKVTKRKESLGLGASTFHDDNWIAHQDDFSALLSKLNQTGSKENEESKQASLQNDVKQSQRKIHYGKFIKSKDLSLKSKNDLACVFGQRSKSTPSTPQQLSEDEGEKSDASAASCPVESHNTEHGFVTVKSEMNLQEYFAQRMAALKQRTENEASGVCIAAVEEDVPYNDSKEERKKSKSKKRKMKADIENGGNEIADCGHEKIVKVKEKKEKKRKKEQNTETETNEVRDVGIEKIEKSKEKKDKKRKKKQNTEIETNEVWDIGIEKIQEVKEKKSKKRAQKETVCENVNTDDSEKLCDGEEMEIDGAPRKKSKMSKRTENENLDVKNKVDSSSEQEDGMAGVSDKKSKKTKKSKKLKVCNEDGGEVIDTKAETQENSEECNALNDLIPKKKKKSKMTRTDDKTEEANESAALIVSENVERKKENRKEKKKRNKIDDFEKNEQQKTEISEKEDENEETKKACGEKRKKERKNESDEENNELTSLDKKSKKKKKKQ